ENTIVVIKLQEIEFEEQYEQHEIFFYLPNIKATLMNVFKNKEPETVEVKGHQLVCPICSNNLFYTKNVLLHRGVFAGEWSKTFVCTDCTYIFWFWSRS